MLPLEDLKRALEHDMAQRSPDQLDQTHIAFDVLRAITEAEAALAAARWSVMAFDEQNVPAVLGQLSKAQEHISDALHDLRGAP